MRMPSMSPIRAGMLSVIGLVAACAGVPESGPADQATLARLQSLASHPCNMRTAEALAGLGIGADGITQVVYDVDTASGESTGRGQITGYRAWIGLADQPGRLVVVHDRDCNLRSSYTSTFGY